MELKSTDLQKKMMVELIPLLDDDRERFIDDNQESFRYGAMEEFGLRDSHFEENGQIISRATIAESLDRAGARAYRIIADGSVVGGVVLVLNEALTEGELDLLFVKPEEHSCGIGQLAWRKVEELYPSVRLWVTHTPHFETRNIHFYVNRLGFQIVAYYHSRFPDPHRRYVASSDDVGMFRFEKQI